MPGLQRATAPSRQTWPVPLASLIRMARAGMTGTPGLWPLSGGHPVKFAGPMFVGDELRLGAGLDAARAGLAKLAHRGLLMSICHPPAAWDQWFATT